jgi:hypothetical protein
LDCQNCDRLVDNGHHFVHTMEQSLKGCGDSPMIKHWKQLIAQNKSEKEAKKNR